MNIKHLTTAVLLGALVNPVLAEAEPDPDLAQSTVTTTEQIDAPPQADRPAPQADLARSRGMTPEEIERIMPLIREFEAQAFGPDQVLDEPPAFIRTAFLGVNAEPVDLDTGKLLGLKPGTGLVVTYIAAGGPAGEAGLKKDDVLTRLGDQVLVNAEQFAVLVRSHEIGDTVKLHGLRAGEPIELEAKLGEADARPLGPGGGDLKREWRVQINPLNDPVGNPLGPEVEVRPGVWIGDGWGDARIRMLEQRNLPENVQEMMRDIELRMLEQRQEMDQRMRQLRLQLDLDLEALRGQGDHPRNHRQGARHQTNASLAWSDGKHQIKIRSENGMATMTIHDADGKSLYDGPIPNKQQIEDLPEEVQQKALQMLGNPNLRPHLPQGAEPDDDQPVKQPAPGVSNREALPNTLAALELLEKKHEDLVFDVWHGADLDLAELRSRLDLKDADADFKRERLLASLQSIYGEVFGNSEMRAVLSQVEVREGLKKDLASISETLGDNAAARKAVQEISQHLNNNLLIQLNDDEHRIWIEGVGLLQKLTIEKREDGEVLYSGFARVQYDFLSGKTDEPGIKDIEDLPQAVKDKVKRMLSPKAVRALLSDGC